MNRRLFARLSNLALKVRPYFDLPVIGFPPLQIAGSLPDASSLGSLLAVLGANGMPAFGSSNFATSAAASITLTNIGNLLQRLTNGGAVTVTIDSAYNIVNNLPFPVNGQTFPFTIVTNAGTTVATPTLSDTAVTLSGTTTVLAAAARWYQGQITQLATTVGSSLTTGTTFTSLTQVGSTNNYTVALGTNAISPTVGNVIFINVTAGTLPSGWYSINKVTSATSFVIAAPSAGTAWTATAATLPGTVLVPASQYTPGFQGIYSPLMTITGLMATVTATMSV
jgi:hypothetical protein